MQTFFGVAEVCLLLARSAPYPASRTLRLLLVFHGGDPNALKLTRLHVLAGAMMILGGLMRLSTYKSLGKFFTFQVGIQKDHRLIKSGLYSVVRHPSYSAMLLTQPGAILWNAAPGSWVQECGLLNTKLGALICSVAAFWLAASVYFIPISRMQREDNVLKEKFGQEWEEWAKQVPYKLIPFIY
ncbi:hypothetical protein CVT24_010912 [Panaeolus cyanescens]|uniref:Protein-S-isoprenylcysteine O-methyltransferase n=1 Tax=Panaeolus cyanescens TaxID=181874 RepID=A0A409XBA5_9AGAR|nr:hypothetical protein CVT24_010912 [Panaeolus cyanescens]